MSKLFILPEICCTPKNNYKFEPMYQPDTLKKPKIHFISLLQIFLVDSFTHLVKKNT
jgi:hypothetical protein